MLSFFLLVHSTPAAVGGTPGYTCSDSVNFYRHNGIRWPWAEYARCKKWEGRLVAVKVDPAVKTGEAEAHTLRSSVLSLLSVSSAPFSTRATKPSQSHTSAAPNLVAASGTPSAPPPPPRRWAGTTKGRGDTGSATRRAPNARDATERTLAGLGCSIAGFNQTHRTRRSSGPGAG